MSHSSTTPVTTADAATPTRRRGRHAASEPAPRTGSRRLAPPTGSRLDDWWANLTATPERRRRVEWIVIGVLTLLAALIRFIRLGDPHKLVFDEVYYVLDGWTLVNEGYEAKFPDDGRDLFVAGDVHAYDPNEPSYVVHPPFGKLLIGWGMQLFGAESAFAWRVAVAFFGTLMVPLLYLVGKRLFNGIVMAAIPALFLAIDGHAIATSRVSILDGLIAFFILLGFYFLLLDRDQQRRQILDWAQRWRVREHANDPSVPLEATPSRWSYTIGRRNQPRPTGPDWGPVLWNRPWLLAMAVTLGLASGIKWSGLYFLAFFCVAAIVFDAAARKEAGITWWLSGAVLKQGWASFLLTIPAAAITYFATWTGWLTTSGGYYRQWVEDNPGDAWQGALSWVPNALQNLWHYHSEALKFHAGLHGDHPYISGALEWPFLLRPTAFSYDYSTAADNPNCLMGDCVTAITSLSNPLAYWLGTIAIVFLMMFFVMKPNWRYGAILLGYWAGYLPWLITGRTSIYQFYVIAWLPFMFLAAAVALQTIAGSPKDDRRSRTVTLGIAVGIVGAIVLVSAWFMPIWTGITIPQWFWNTMIWLPGWK